MGASIDGWLVGGVALGIFVFTRWLLKKRWRNYRWWDSVAITILLLFAVWMISFTVNNPQL